MPNLILKVASIIQIEYDGDNPPTAEAIMEIAVKSAEGGQPCYAYPHNGAARGWASVTVHINGSQPPEIQGADDVADDVCDAIEDMGWDLVAAKKVKSPTQPGETHANQHQ